MAKAKTVKTVTVETVPANGESTDLEIESAADQGDLIRALSEIEGADEVRWNITRVSPMQTAGYCCTVSSGDLTMEHLSDELGPGKYRVRGHYADGSFAGGRTITIAVQPKSKEASPAGGSSVQDLLAIMAERDEARGKNMLAWVTALAPVLAATLPNLFKGTQLSDLTAALANMKAMQPDAPSQIETLLKGITLAKELTPDKGGESNWMDVVREIAGPLMGKVTAAPIITPAMPAITDQTAPAQPVENPMMQVYGWMRATLGSLIEQARRDKDPALYAEVTLDNLPEGVDASTLKQYIAREDWWTVLQQFNPAVAPYQGWFEKFRAEVLSFIDEAEHGGDPDSLREGDSTGSTSINNTDDAA